MPNPEGLPGRGPDQKSTTQQSIRKLDDLIEVHKEMFVGDPKALLIN